MEATERAGDCASNSSSSPRAAPEKFGVTGPEVVTVVEGEWERLGFSLEWLRVLGGRSALPLASAASRAAARGVIGRSKTACSQSVCEDSVSGVDAD